MKAGEVLAFAGPLIGEAVGLIGSFIKANSEDQAALIAQRDAAIGAMREAKVAEVARHETDRDETRRIIEAEEKKQHP